MTSKSDCRPDHLVLTEAIRDACFMVDSGVIVLDDKPDLWSFIAGYFAMDDLYRKRGEDRRREQ